MLLTTRISQGMTEFCIEEERESKLTFLVLVNRSVSFCKKKWYEGKILAEIES